MSDRLTQVPAGLCATCVNQRRVESGRGSVFILCQLSSQDPRYPRYPRLPVLQCAGYAPASDDPAEPRDRAD